MDARDLARYAAAWNAHDLAAIMAMMTDDCVFEAGGGTPPGGDRYAGREAVARRFAEVWEALPDVAFVDLRHFVSGDRGCSEWTLTASAPDGRRIAQRGCDLFTFRDGLIARKDTFLKSD